ncbi:8698_t:CDS:2 [Paraglomus occultum]|uniref:8698_t:CDS:1 n=1 Tax=Paraglomus occultum TaxID=144539 RepID=A0A9N9FFM8_9GLOM|nr:8698_t:CDS:2 [Paraglomus occultum]
MSYPEPKFLRWSRIVVGFLIVIIYVFYLAYLGWGIARDTPVLKLSLERLDSLQVPEIEICAPASPLILTKCTFNAWQAANTEVFENCTRPTGEEFIYLKNFSDPNQFCYLFSTNKTYMFSKTDLFRIDFFYKIADLPKAWNSSISIPALALQAFNPDFNPLWRPEQLKNSNYKYEVDMRLQTNNFISMAGWVTSMSFQQYVFRDIDPRDFGAVSGFAPQYHNTSTIVTTAKYFPLRADAPGFGPDGDTGVFSVQAESYFQQVQEQQRSKTILSALGLAGGAFGAICGVYMVLFGQPRLKPWGALHYLVRKPTKIQDPLNIPLVSPVLSSQLTTTSEQRLSHLEGRLQELEGLLQDYFIDPSYLRNVKNKLSTSFSSKVSPEHENKGWWEDRRM